MSKESENIKRRAISMVKKTNGLALWLHESVCAFRIRDKLAHEMGRLQILIAQTGITQGQQHTHRES